MPYTVSIKPKAKKYLEALRNARLYQSLHDAIGGLASNPGLPLPQDAGRGVDQIARAHEVILSKATQLPGKLATKKARPRTRLPGPARAYTACQNLLPDFVFLETKLVFLIDPESIISCYSNMFYLCISGKDYSVSVRKWAILLTGIIVLPIFQAFPVELPYPEYQGLSLSGGAAKSAVELDKRRREEENLARQVAIQKANNIILPPIATADISLWQIHPRYRGKKYFEAPQEMCQHLLDAYPQIAHLIPDIVNTLARENPATEADADSSPPAKSNSNEPTATGTGFFVTANGYLVTNAHVVKGSSKFRIVTASGVIDATVVQVNEANDLALLKAEGVFIPLPVTASRSIRLGSTVATVGFPNVGLQGFNPKLAKGEIAAMSGIQDDARYFQISLPVQPGNSGGPLVDEHGNVVGVVSAKLSAKAAFDATGQLPENVNYAVKSSFVLGFLESVPAASQGMMEPNTKDVKFEDVVSSTQLATVLVLVY